MQSCPVEGPQSADANEMHCSWVVRGHSHTHTDTRARSRSLSLSLLVPRRMPVRFCRPPEYHHGVREALRQEARGTS